MKKMLTLALGALSLSMLTVCALAQGIAMPAVPIKVEAYVHDPDGNPLEGARVHLSLPRYRLGDRNQWADANTSIEGVAIVSGVAQQDYQVGADKTGYYHTTGPHRAINTGKGFQQYAVEVQKIDLELRPIRNPIGGISNAVRLKIPVFGKSLGFDMEAGDWVAPHGRGKTADFIFTVAGYFNGPNDYDQSLTLTFSNPSDGIILAKFPPRIGSAYKFPYEAPLTGYESRRVWTKTFNGKTEATSIDNSGETNYIFRVRTELDERGDLRRAMHGVIASEVVIGGNNEIGRNISFTYALNPDWTRNIEFDPTKTASSPR